MEHTEEVLVVIQAESGEEIALPLAALDEQHQEVVVESNGTSSIVDGNNSESLQFPVLQHNHSHTNQGDEDDQLRAQHELQTREQQPLEEGGEQQLESQVNSAKVQQIPEIEPTSVPRQKQKRKERLVCLPLSEEDLKLEFQFVEEPAQQIPEDVKRKPRKEYRTKKKLAALEAAKEKQTSTTTVQELRQRDKSPQQKPKQQKQQQHSPHQPTSPEPAADDAQLKLQVKLENSIELSPQAQGSDLTPTHALQQHERRTRLSNVCRVATGKSYKCHDCGFTTERINNISLHIKKACPKLFANQ